VNGKAVWPASSALPVLHLPRYDLGVNLDRGRNARVPHLTLHRFSDRPRLEQTMLHVTFAGIASSQQPQLFGRCFDVSSQNVLVVHRLALLNAPKNQIVRLLRTNQFVFPDRTPPNLDRLGFQRKNAGDYLR
jgi:hypothetical protein